MRVLAKTKTHKLEAKGVREMKTLIKTSLVFGLLLAGSFSYGEGLEHKPTKIQFNERIDKTENSQSQLQSELTSLFDRDEDLDFLNEDADLKQEKQKVVDFIDAELHVGGRDDNKVVDRRFNSEGPAKIADNPDEKALKKDLIN